MNVWRALVRLPALLVIGLIRLYQRFISPMTGPSCKFHPTCSAYAVDQSADARAAEGFGLDCGTLGSMPPLATRRYQSTATCGEVALRR